MCALDAHDKNNKNCSGSISIRSVINIPYNSTTNVLKSFCVAINFIYMWLKYLEENYVWRFQSYELTWNQCLNNNERQLILTNIEGGCYI